MDPTPLPEAVAEALPIDAPPWGRFDSAAAMAASPLHDGRFTVRLAGADYECFLQRGEGPFLFVMLSGPRPPAATRPALFERWNWGPRVPGSVLCVADPLHQLAGEPLRVGWYLGTQQHDGPGRLAGLVRAVAGALGVPTRRVVCCGSTSGGFAALMLAARLKDATALAINPHTQVLRCASVLVDEVLRLGFDRRPAAALEASERARFSAIGAFRRAPAARCLIVQNLEDAAPAAAHFEPFCSALGIPTGGGASADGLRASMVYSQPVGNRREPGTMITRIIAAAVRLGGLPPAAAPAADGPLAAPSGAGAAPRILAQQLYLINNRRQARLRDSVTFIPRDDATPFPIVLPLDWGADPFADRNWCGQLHMWRMMENHILEFEQTQDPTWLRLPIDIMVDWHDYHVVRRRNSKFAWLDMMVGMRAMKLAFLASANAHGVVRFSEAEARACDKLIELHLQFLLDPANVAYSNHTFIDMHGLAALGVVVNDTTRARIRTFLGEVVPRLLASQFDAAGVHLENSPGYQAFGIGCLKRLAGSGWFEEHGVSELLRRAQQVNEWFRMPDGRCVPVGDTDGAAMTGQAQTAFSATRQLIDSSGYVIWRDDGGGQAQRASYLFFMAAFNSRFHKQNDDLSLAWYEGEDILCDAGKFAYKSGEMQQYVQSARAHNSIEIDGRNVADNLSRRPDLVYGSAVRETRATAWGFQASARVRHRELGVTHERHLAYAAGRWLLIVDEIDADAEHELVQWFHFSPHLDLVPREALVFDAALRSGRRLTVRGAAIDGLTTVRIRGQVEPVRQGWVSQAYGQLSPCDTLGFRQRGQRLRFATLLSLDDRGSTLKLRDGALEARIRTDIGSDVVHASWRDGNCDVDCQPEAGAPV